jgi:hypothetical protein
MGIHEVQPPGTVTVVVVAFTRATPGRSTMATSAAQTDIFSGMRLLYLNITAENDL